MSESSELTLPVAVIGAGPVGLAAAAHLLASGEEVIVFERGPSAGANILAWGHVRLFSPWRYVVDAAAAKLLAGAGGRRPIPRDTRLDGRLSSGICGRWPIRPPSGHGSA